MAVQQNKKSASKRGMHRSHDFLTNPPLAVEPTTGELHYVITSARTVSIAARRSSRPRASNGSPAFGCPMAQLKGMTPIPTAVRARGRSGTGNAHGMDASHVAGGLNRSIPR